LGALGVQAPFRVKPEATRVATGTTIAVKRQRKIKKTDFFVNFKTSSHLPDFYKCENAGWYMIKLSAMRCITHKAFYKGNKFASSYTENKISSHANFGVVVLEIARALISKKGEKFGSSGFTEPTVVDASSVLS